MAKRKKPAHLVILEKMEAHFGELEKIFNAERGKNMGAVRPVHLIRYSLELLEEMVIPKRSLKRVITRLRRMRDVPEAIGALYDPLCKTVENLERRKG